MFGLWFSVLGLFFGFICASKAKGKNRATHEWFLLGFLFSFLAIVVLSFLDAIDHNLNMHQDIVGIE